MAFLGSMGSSYGMYGGSPYSGMMGSMGGSPYMGMNGYNQNMGDPSQ